MLTRPGEVIALHGHDTNALVTVTVPAVANVKPYLSKLTFGYDATPTGGRVEVTVAGEVVFSAPVTAAGPGPVNVNIPGVIHQGITVTLAAGGSGVRGDLNVEYHKGNR